MRWVPVLALVMACAGCGGRGSHKATELSFEGLPDTTGLSKGEALLTAVEPYRMANGALRVRGVIAFPDGARLQISVYRRSTHQMVGRLQVIVRNHRFDSPPLVGQGGPLPREEYRFEYLAHFNQIGRAHV